MSDSQVAPWRDTFWEQLRSGKPDDICSKAAVQYTDDKFYTVIFMDNKYRVYPVEEKVEGTEEDTLAVYPKFELVLLSYLIHAMNVPLTGDWISEKELPGGSTFFRGPHRLPDDTLIEKFGSNKDSFIATGKKLDGTKLEYGDASFGFRVLPRVSLACVLWVEDEEFPARVHYLFDSSITNHFALDVVYALIRSFIRKFLDP